jgi:hypothetical protein
VPSATLKIDGLPNAWRGGGAQVKRQLLMTPFDGLVVPDGAIVEYVPRADRTAEVIALMRLALDGKDTIEAPAA